MALEEIDNKKNLMLHKFSFIYIDIQHGLNKESRYIFRGSGWQTSLKMMGAMVCTYLFEEFIIEMKLKNIKKKKKFKHDQVHLT